MDVLLLPILYLILELIIFLCLTFIGMYIIERLTKSSNRFLNPLEFLPEGEIHTIRQLLYLIMMALSFVNVIYSLIFPFGEIFYFEIFDLILSLAIAINLDKGTTKNKILLILLVPFGALTYMIFGTYVGLLDILHILTFIYFIKFYYDKFTEYTRANRLGATILLIFAIIFVSFFITQIVEHVNALDSLVMVSNAFTSNGYAILGSSIPGKLNSIFLVWGGYILSGASTATLTAALLIRYFNKRVRKLEEIIEQGSDEV